MTSHIDELLMIANQISSGKIPRYQHNETFTSGAFDLLILKVRGKEAFDVLSQLCARYESVKTHEENLKSYYYLITEVARQTGTTEMPRQMLKIIKDNTELSTELRQWYRYVG